MTVIDGDQPTPPPTAVSVARERCPISIAVNPVTNKIYVANQLANDVTVIDGATNTTSTVNTLLGEGPSLCHRREPGDEQDLRGEWRAATQHVTVIDGATNATATALAVGAVTLMRSP